MSANIDAQMMEAKLEKVREWYSENARPYRPPREINAEDTADIQEIDEIKLHELKEVKYYVHNSDKINKGILLVLHIIRSKQ